MSNRPNGNYQTKSPPPVVKAAIKQANSNDIHEQLQGSDLTLVNNNPNLVGSSHSGTNSKGYQTYSAFLPENQPDTMYNSHEDGQVLYGIGSSELQSPKTGIPPKGSYAYKAATSDSEFIEFSQANPAREAHPLAH